jgi:hypothetical protein
VARNETKGCRRRCIELLGNEIRVGEPGWAGMAVGVRAFCKKNHEVTGGGYVKVAYLLVSHQI